MDGFVRLQVTELAAQEPVLKKPAQLDNRPGIEISTTRRSFSAPIARADTNIDIDVLLLSTYPIVPSLFFTKPKTFCFFVLLSEAK